MGRVSEMMLEMKYGHLYIHDYIKCPCGKSTVCVDKDNTPGFKSRDITCQCDECREKYYVTDSCVDDGLHQECDGHYYEYMYSGRGDHYSYYYRPKDAKSVK